jgi:hypothetical protein
MKKSIKLSILSLLSAGLLLTNCNKFESQEDIEPLGKEQEKGKAEPQGTIHENENGRIELFPNAKPVTVADAKMLTSITEDKLVYSGKNDFFNSIKAGDILISPNTDIAPDGYLRLVNSVEKTNDGYIFYATNTTLDKAIKNGELHLAAPIMFPSQVEDVASGVEAGNEAKANGSQAEAAGTFTLTKTFSYPLNHILYDYDGNYSGTTYDQIKTNGNFTLTASMVLDLNFSGGTLTYLRVRAPLSAGNNQTLTLGGTLNLPSKTAQLANVTTIPSAGFFVGVVYVSIKPYFNLYIDYSGSISAYAKFGYNGSTTITPEIKYQNNTWTTAAPKTFSLTGTKPVTNVSATFRASLRPRLTFALYGCTSCASAYLEGSVYGSITCSLTPVSKQIKGGLAASAGAVLFGFNKSYNNFLNYPINL